jgi:biotin carboxyl carrier protein
MAVVLRVLFVVLVLALVAFGGFTLWHKRSLASAVPMVAVTRGSLVRKVVLAGHVDVAHAIPVHAPRPGVVRKVAVELGQKVSSGDALGEVWPAVDEHAVAAAERVLATASDEQDAAQELLAGTHLRARMLRWLEGERALQRDLQSAQRRRLAAADTLDLLREGSVVREGASLDHVVRAPVAGHVLQIARPGATVLAGNEATPGTVVAVLGDLELPVFTSLAEEGDAARLQIGMPARVTLSALPDVELTGRVTEIGVLARRPAPAHGDQRPQFEVRIALTPAAAVTLRAGYSAAAAVELSRADAALLVPRSCVQVRSGRAYVLVAGEAGASEERVVTTGISDGAVIEIKAGLRDGELVLERGASR